MTFKVAAWIGEAARGRVTMARVLNEILAYSFMAAFVTGIVVLAAATFISQANASGIDAAFHFTTRGRRLP